MGPEDSGRPLGIAPRMVMDGDLTAKAVVPIGSRGTGTGGRLYEVIATIDRGGMGELFLATVTRPGRPVEHAVLKRLLTDLLDDDKYVSMFQSESDVMSRLRHPNIVRVFDNPKIEGSTCLAMEYVRGRNVQQILSRTEARNETIPPEIAILIMIQTLRGLHYAHEFKLESGDPLNLVHRDVTPGNILVSFDGNVKLTDFGIAKSSMSLVSTTVGIVKGKARYLSPEQILGEVASPRSDIFSAAGVMIEMLTGEPAFDRPTVPKTLYAIVNGEYPDLEQQLSFRAPLLIQTLRQALETDHKNRFQTASEFADALEAAQKLLARPVDAADVGGYISSLFQEDGEAVVTDREQRVLSSPERSASFGEAYGAPPPTPPPPPNLSSAESVSANDIEEAEALVRASAYGSHPSLEAPIVKGTPLTPGPGQPATEAVDEALSALAWLQSNQKLPKSESTPDLVAESVAAVPSPLKLTTSALPGPAPIAAPSGFGRREGLIFAAGLAIGGLVTAIVQSTWRSQPANGANQATVTPPVPPQTKTAAKPPPVPPPPKAPPPAALPPPPAVAAVGGALDITFPRGGRAYLDGKLVAGRIPVNALEIEPGAHHLRVRKGSYEKSIEFRAEPGARYELGRRFITK